MTILILFILFSSVISLNNTKCNDNIFILISTKTVFLINFDFQNINSSNIIYQTKSNTTIEYGLFNKQTNTIILLINQLNKTYSIISLNTYDNIYNYWIEKSSNIIYSSYVYLSLGQRYFYLLNIQTMLLEIFTFPLTTISFKENYLLNLPINQTLINYVIDEKINFLWILFDNYQYYQLYICQLNTYSCYLYMNIFNLNKPIKFYINSIYKQLYFYSKNYLIIYQYNQNQTNYSINYLNFTQEIFLTICEKTNHIQYIFINYTNKSQVCLQTCQYLPLILNDTSYIHTIQRLSSLSDILYCSKQRQISKIVIIILILIDIAVSLGFIVWFTYKYFYQSTLYKHTKQSSTGTIWTMEKDFITHF